MKLDCPGRLAAGGWRSFFVVLMSVSLLAGCAPQPVNPRSSERNDVPGTVPALAYYQMQGRLNAAELAKERSVLAVQPATPNVQIRQAMLLGHPRVGQDLNRALALLEVLLKLTDPSAVELQPLTRLLADQYTERLRLETQLDRLGGQLKESQRKAQEAQEKLDSLADIERTLTPPPRSGKGVPQ
ncbi:MAG: permease [Betaproteobacteria bacterium HGW-Betaproteobacteria-7]|nr:MAG: permease [Betaproteobacteria bacterium HGW-Betaproteobacteria-7]